MQNEIFKNVSIPSSIVNGANGKGRIGIFLIIIMTYCMINGIQGQCTENCMSCSSTGICTSCVTQSNLLLIANSTLGCLPCPTKCEKCTNQSSQASCATCSQGYYLDPYLLTCAECQSPNCLQCNEYYPSQCLQCQSTFYLQESTGSCKSCPSEYNGAKTCRQGFILTCQQGYFTSNGQVCSKCDVNGTCKACVSGSACSQCFDGFYLSGGKCLGCEATCKTCSTSTSCTSCNKGYRINTSSKCQPCTTANCASCTMQDVCQQCSSSYYLDNSNKTCTLIVSPTTTVQNCTRYANNFNLTITQLYPASTVLCRTCANGTYFSLQTNTCQSCSLLCENCAGMFRSSKCSSCNKVFGRMVDSVNGICGTKMVTDAGEKVFYKNNRNDANVYERIGKVGDSAEGLMKCPGGRLASEVKLSLIEAVGYQYTLHLKLLLQSPLSPPYSITISLNSIPISTHPITSPQPCGNIKIANLSLSFSISQLLSLNNLTSISSLLNSQTANSFSFKSSSQNDTLLDVREIVLLVKKCHGTCGLCDVYENCLQCKGNGDQQDLSLLQEERCVSKCDTGYFLYLNQSKCLLECPKGTYSSVKSITWTCQTCPSQCSQCISSTVCTSCSTGFYLYSKQCLSSCPSTYFKNSLFNKCQKCTSPCDECQSIKQCLSCQVGFYFNANMTCMIDCPDGFYGEMETMACEKCEEPCYTCKSISSCLSCTAASGLAYSNSLGCISTCPSQYFRQLNAQSNQFTCELCSFPCQQCTNTSTTCTKCITGYLLSSNNTCLSQCPEQYFSSITNLACISCAFPCRSCLNSEKFCTKCVDGYLLMESSCVKQCSEGFYKKTSAPQECKACKDQCLTCQTEDICTNCKDGFYLSSQRSCLSDCLDGYFKSINPVGQRICSKCSSGCSKCFGQADYCHSCITNYFLQPNNVCSSSCSKTELFPGCSPCEYPCYSCQTTTTNCTSCVNTYFFYESINECVTECYLGYYKDVQNGFGFCKACESPCINCQSPRICYSCSQINGTKFYLQTKSPNQKVCRKQCDLFEYKDDEKLMCLKCSSPCLTCKNATYCETCINGILTNGNCVDKVDGCPIGNYPESSIITLDNGENTTVTTCRACPQHCSSCKSETVCTGCIEEFYLYGESCVDFCPSGSSPIKQLRKCILCEYPCVQCEGTSSYCKKCGEISLNSTGVLCPESRKLDGNCIKYYLLNGECISDCPSMTLPKSDTCVACVSPCSTCTSQTVCTSCVSGYFMLQNGCYSTCPDQYYKETLTEQCQRCIYPCKTCLDQQRCLQCREGYLFQNKCLIKDNCPVGYFQASTQSQGKICSKCDSGCIACVDSSDYCLECNQMSEQEGNCLAKCPNGYYSKVKASSYVSNRTTLQCQECSPQCLTCQSLEHCQSCVFSYSLLGNKCVNRCPPGYMQKFQVLRLSSEVNYTVSLCTACVSPCSSCFLEENLCQSCVTGYFMYERKCLLECPEGTYLDQLTKSCKECPFPCKLCHQQQNDLRCDECSKGYYVLNGVCVDKCKQKFIDFGGKNCVDDCKGGYQVTHILTKVDYCAKQCQLPYLKSEIEKKCVTDCSQNEYINAEYECKTHENSVELLIPKLKSHLYVDQKGTLTLFMQFSRPVEYTDSVSLESTLSVSLNTIEATNGKKATYRMLQSLASTSSSTTSTTTTSQSIPFTLNFQSSTILVFSLYPRVSLYYPSSLSLAFESNSQLYIIDMVSKMPLQLSSFSIELKQTQFYQFYDQTLIKQNKFGYVGEIIMDFVLILGLGLIAFNRFAKIYHLLVFGQSVFMLVCLDIPMPPNLYRFLQGFKFAHFHQIGNWFSSLKQQQKYTDFSGNNFNRIESIFGDITFLRVSGHLIGLYCILIVLTLILYGVRYLPAPRNEYLKQIFQLMSQKFKQIKWSYLTDVFMSTFMLIMASFFFQTIDYSTNKTQQSVSIALSYIFFLLLTSYCAYFCYKTFKTHVQSQKEPQKFVQKGYMFKQNYIPFYEGIGTPQSSYKNYMLVGKIAAYGGLTGLAWQYPDFCLAVWIVLEIAFAVIYWWLRPFADDVQNLLYSVCGAVYTLAMILLIVVNQCQNPQSTFFIPQSQQQRKILIGYFIIVLILICTFILITEMIRSIMRGNPKPRKLEGEEEQYNQVKENSPSSLTVTKLLDNVPKKIFFEEKKQFVGYQVQEKGLAPNVKKGQKHKNRTSIKQE